MPTIYRTTNLVNDKIYIGYHNDSDPSYLGYAEGTQPEELTRGMIR